MKAKKAIVPVNARPKKSSGTPPKPSVPRPSAKHILRLYVAGATERSNQAIRRARAVCETELKGNYELEVIDVYQQPIMARDGQIVATPTLVRQFPKPVRRLIGNLTKTSGLFVGLALDSAFGWPKP